MSLGIADPLAELDIAVTKQSRIFLEEFFRGK